jgi:hypothetical protein
MNGGVIRNNTNAYGGPIGVGVQSGNPTYGRFIMTGGTITDNTTAGSNVAIWIQKPTSDVSITPKAPITLEGAITKDATASSKDIVVTPLEDHPVSSVIVDGQEQVAGEDGRYVISTVNTGLSITLDTPDAGDEYDVNVPEFVHGTVTSNRSKAVAGETVTLTVTPAIEVDVIYALSENGLSVTKEDGEPIAVEPQAGGGNRYTFTMPDGSVTVGAVFEIDPAQAYTFTVGNVESSPGATVNVPLTITNNRGFNTLGLYVSYDQTQLECQGLASANNTEVYFYSINDRERIDLSGNNTSPTVVYSLKFRVKGIATGTLPIAVTPIQGACKVTGVDLTTSAMTIVSGSITVAGDPPAPSAVTVSPAITGGAVTVDRASAVIDDTVSITIIPDDGKVLATDSLRLNNTLLVGLGTHTEDGLVYTFIMPATAVTITAAFAEPLTFTVGQVSALPGETVEVPLTVTNSHAGVFNWLFNVEFDTTRLECLGVNAPAVFTASFYAHTVDGENVVILRSPSSADFADSTFGLSLVFRVKDGVVGTSPISIVNKQYQYTAMLDSPVINDYDLAVAVTVPGSVTVEDTTPPDPEVGEPGSGDLDGDGSATAAEALTVSRYVTVIGTLSEAQIAAADIDGDGVLTMLDAILLMRRAVGL